MLALLAIYRVTGESMLPTLRPGQFVLSSSLPYFFRKPKVGDIVIVQIDGQRMVKRVVTQADGQYDVRGDNLDASTDSRSFGPIPRTAILARVFFI